MYNRYQSKSDFHFKDLTWILVGIALADRDRVPDIAALMTEHAREVTPHTQRQILAAIIEGNGEKVWDSLKAIGAERQPDNPTERAVDAVMREIRRCIHRHMMIVMESKLAKKAQAQDVESFARMMQEMLEELQTEAIA